MNSESEKKFQRFFGISSDECGDVLIISPFFSAKLFAPYLRHAQLCKGIFYHGVSGVYEEKKVTFINTGMGQTLTADCVLAQDPQRTKAIIFLGAVGALQNFNIGQGVLVQEAFFDAGFFAAMGLSCLPDQPQRFCPDAALSADSRQMGSEQGYELEPVKVISIHTLWEQEQEKALRFIGQGMQAVDLECALLYAAAAKQKIKTVALGYVSDQLLNKPFWSDFSRNERLTLKEAMVKLVKIALQVAAQAS